ncbi:MAG TPA: type II secretion system protein GspK [Bradyrhizobium sp.]|nr:type II secretion system protein GspK [Bradyrhizobium sp.]
MPVISVLWGLGLLTAISLSLLWNGNMSWGLAHNGREAAGIHATAEAAVNRAVVALLDLRPERRWRTDGVAQRFEFGGTPIKISIQDELGRIDLNQAEAPMFIGLLQSAGLDLASATSLADKILDWRTATALKHLNGAKEQDYRASGSAYRPRNGPFQSVDELLLVMDMTPALFRRIEPALTVYSGRPLIDPQVAPREALLALPGMTPDKVDPALAARGNPRLAIDPLAGGVMASPRGRAFTIRIEFEKSNRTIVVEAAVRLTDNPVQPYWLLNWRAR